MEGDFIKVRDSLLPLSWLYGGAVGLRNFCFDIGLLKSHAFHVPIIAVGNITVGGTGKTPHVEYLVRLLQKTFHVAVLSRGYKRKSKGFLLADGQTTVEDIGDEPMQMKQKFPGISVAVDKKRVHGIQQLTSNDEQLDVILLDDAFQHRYVKPGVNILLVDYHRLIIYDKLLPAGRLREPLKGKNRADIVIITKCPKGMKPMEFRVIRKAMDLFPYQHLYYTTLDYDNPQPVFQAPPLALSEVGNQHLLLLTGIASPRQLRDDLKTFCQQPDDDDPGKPMFQSLTYPDHHNFRQKDVERINNAFAQLPAPKAIITTEKDAVRLTVVEGLSDEVRSHLYTIPINIRFMQQEQAEKFNEFIVGYVQKNSRNSILAKGKDNVKVKEQPPIPSNNPHTISFK